MPVMSDPWSDFHGDEGTKQRTRAQLLNITAEDSGEQRSSDSLDDLITKVAAHECCDAFVRVGSAIQEAVSRNSSAREGSAMYACFADSVKNGEATTVSSQWAPSCASSRERMSEPSRAM